MDESTFKDSVLAIRSEPIPYYQQIKGLSGPMEHIQTEVFEEDHEILPHSPTYSPVDASSPIPEAESIKTSSTGQELREHKKPSSK